MTTGALDFTLRKEISSNLTQVFGQGRWSLHLMLWCLVVLFVHFLQHESFGSVFSWSFMIILASVAGFCYSFILWITPFHRYRSNNWILAGSTIFNIFLWWAILFFNIARYYHYYPETMPGLYRVEKGMILGVSLGQMLLMSWTFFACYYFVDLYNQQKNLNRYRQVLTDKLHAELALLKTQVNPHFLFNTLNSIYSLALKQDGSAADIAYRLRDLLHYMLYDCTKDTVSLADEIGFLKNYVSLEEQRNRKEDVRISFVVEGDPGNKEIGPLLLINFVENAFKHGVKSGIGQSAVTMHLTIKDRELSFSISNSKPSASGNSGQAIKGAGGIGLNNVRQRLQILYPGRHQLRIEETEITYSVYLSILFS